MDAPKEHRRCEYPGCDKRHLAKGYCQGHYMQWSRGWQMHPLGERRSPKPKRGCSFEGCDRIHASKGYCDRHYRQWKSGAELSPIRDKYAPRPKTPCTFETCDRHAEAKGYCLAHYNQLVRGNELSVINYAENKARYVECGTCGKRFKRRNPRVKYCSRKCSSVKQTSPLRAAIEAGDHEGVTQYTRENAFIDDNGCWVWQGRIANEYPVTSARSGTQFVHRAVLEAKLGQPLGVNQAHHICSNRSCVNPDHLQAISQRENIAEMQQRKYYNARIAQLEDVVRSLDPGHPVLAESHFNTK